MSVRPEGRDKLYEIVEETDEKETDVMEMDATYAMDMDATETDVTGVTEPDATKPDTTDATEVTEPDATEVTETDVRTTPPVISNDSRAPPPLAWR